MCGVLQGAGKQRGSFECMGGPHRVLEATTIGALRKFSYNPQGRGLGSLAEVFE